MLVDGSPKKRQVWLSSHSDVLRLSRVYGCESKEVKCVLTIAHLDHDEFNTNVQDSRLAALCQYCHLNYDSKEKARRKKAPA